ncbi:MAG: membrane protein insertase YidC, partial [Planctomycetota bacterium]|nr:membrane protein insertase YidC [Planctomycetota bacterium]
ELALGDFFQRNVNHLSEEEKGDPDNWTRLLEPVRTPYGESGSLLLRTSTSSEALAPAGLDEVLWMMEELRDQTGRPLGVEFRYGPGTGIVFVKRIERVPGSWRLKLRIAIENIENTAAASGPPSTFLLTPAGCMPEELGDRFYREPRAVAIGGTDDDWDLEWEHAGGVRDESGSLDVAPPLLVVGAHNKYFAFLLRGADDDGDMGRHSLKGATYRGVKDLDYADEHPDDPKGAWRYVAADVQLDLRVPEVGSTNVYEYTIYAGPKDPRVLKADYEAQFLIYEKDLSTFSTIGKAILFVLRFFHGLVGNMGVAIILLTLCVRGALFPLNRRSQTAMARYQKKMKRVQPKLEEIKQTHANDAKKLREAQAKLMQEEGAFPPIGGCLPMFLQMPIFFGLFSALRTAFDLRQEPFFFWIDDLARPDRLFEINLPLPIIGTIQYLNLLPLLMMALMLTQQLGMPKPTDEQAARMQKMMMFMPFMFGFFLYSYAAGLSLYVITSSTFGIIEMRVIKKIWPIDDSEPVKKKKSGCAPFAGMMKNLAEKQREQRKRMEQMKHGLVPRQTRKKKGKKRH